jgi:hypothetical protein
MRLADIYNKLITRNINPAVVAQDREVETIKTEIDEYVFTDEIINNIYKVLLAIKNKDDVSKTGIWVNGYYGSGKSHFLKYLHYCIAPDTRQKAFERLILAVKERDTLLRPDSKIKMNNTDIASLKRWYDQAIIDDILFNAQDVSKENKDKTTFTQIFFNMFNQSRGYNAYNIPLAILLEKYLDINNAFELFKSKIEEEEGFVWEKDAADVVGNELDTVLRIAKECAPSLDIEALKATLLNQETYHIDTRKFASELKSFIDAKGDNYRFIFLVDEVSQFVNTNKDVLLDLQTVIESISLSCNRQVWVTCTAQQTIDSVIENTGINGTDEAYGKIMGRFETRVSLESTDPAFITQKRILEKKPVAELELKKIYKTNQDAILNQFNMGHDIYKSYRNEDDFLLSYPFVPYQFKLIAKVFEAFQQLDYVVAEVKDNERSVLKITHETAKQNKELELGAFIPFDAFFNQMFWQNLIHKGTKAISPALEVVKDNDFAQRVVKLLFMISNLSDKEKLNFGSTLDNLTLLMMSKLDENKLQLRNKVEKILRKLIESNIIREENKNFYFYNEDEVELSTIIANTTLGTDSMADQIKAILFTWLRVDNKVRFAGNDFKVIANIDGKNYLGNNGDIAVAFTITDTDDTITKSLKNSTDTIVFCLNEWFDKDAELKHNFRWFCKVEKYVQNNQDYATEARRRSIDNFKARNRDILETKIKPIIFRKFIETRFISGNTIIEPNEVSGNGAERYQNVIQRHLENVYKYAKLTNGMPTTQEELKQRANRKVAPEEYNDLNPMNDAEVLVNDYITRMGNEVVLSELIEKFKTAPYGWKDISLIHIAAELHKRKLRDFTYRNQARFPLTDFVNKALLTSERQLIGITSVEGISQELINNALSAWLTIFNENIPHTSDGNMLFDRLLDGLNAQKKIWHNVKTEYENYPFAKHLSELSDKLSDLLAVRDPKRLFENIYKDAVLMASLMDKCRNIKDFADNSITDYKDIKRYCDNNEENFNQLDGENRKKVELLKAFFHSDSPANDFRTYKKIHTELKSAVTEKIKSLKEEAKVRYETIFDQLKALADENNVVPTTYADREYKLKSIAGLGSITSLQLTLSQADIYLSDERSKILLEAHKAKQEHIRKEQEQKRLEDIAKGRTPETPKQTNIAAEPVSFYLPKANKILTSESDVEAYLSDIRKKLMDIINDNQKILIK